MLIKRFALWWAFLSITQHKIADNQPECSINSQIPLKGAEGNTTPDEKFLNDSFLLFL